MGLAHRLPGTHPTPLSCPPPSAWSLPPTEKWWEDESCLSPSSLPGLFFCLIGVLLVTINSFLSQLQAALICCHRVKCTVPLPPHYKPQALMPHSFFLSFFFQLSVSASLLLVVIRSRNGFWGLFRFNSYFLLKGRELCLWAVWGYKFKIRCCKSLTHISSYSEVTVCLKMLRLHFWKSCFKQLSIARYELHCRTLNLRYYSIEVQNAFPSMMFSFGFTGLCRQVHAGLVFCSWVWSGYNEGQHL